MQLGIFNKTIYFQVTAPLKGGVIEGGKIAGKKAIEQLVVREAGKIATNVAVRAASEIVADQVSGGSRGGHVSRSSGKKEVGFQMAC